MSSLVDVASTIDYYPEESGGAMGDERADLVIRIRERRRAAGLTQQRLAERAGVSRQALIAIEAGRLVPSVLVALRLARALGCTVEDLFGLSTPGRVEAELADPTVPLVPPFRVHLLRVGDGLVAWPLVEEASEADALVHERDGTRVVAELLVEPVALERSLVLAGCDPALGLLAAQLRRWHRDRRVIWLPLGSQAALRALARGQVHLA
ncbi:MAG: helix-turn-helix domain-containing protein, partial [Thermomicrobium sp.]|nr:helix-turn-helix domain-containing protein [Thermomicrobium sp.]